MVSVGLCAEELVLTNNVAGVSVVVPAQQQDSPRFWGAGLKVRPFQPPFNLLVEEWGEDWDEQAIHPSNITKLSYVFMFVTTVILFP